MSTTRKRLFSLAASTAIVSITSLTPADQVEARDLVVVGWGGALSAAIKASMEDPFQESTGIAISSEVYNGGMAQVKAPDFSSIVDAELGCAEGLLENSAPRSARERGLR